MDLVQELISGEDKISVWQFGAPVCKEAHTECKNDAADSTEEGVQCRGLA